MTDEQLQAIKARCEAASPGPWAWENPTGEAVAMDRLIGIYRTFKDRDCHVGVKPILVPQAYGGDRMAIGPEEDDEDGMANLDFLAHAREDVPALVAEVDRLRALLAGR